MYADLLPLGEVSPVYPFTGYVVNISVCTDGHRDSVDKKICVLVFFGDWEGGELCMFEPGLVFELKAGDVMIFPSADITHFNLHFKGTRGSIVMHSDRYGDSWTKDYNGWGKFMAGENELES